jgi:hypothetical protein
MKEHSHIADIARRRDAEVRRVTFTADVTPILRRQLASARLEVLAWRIIAAAGWAAVIVKALS